MSTKKSTVTTKPVIVAPVVKVPVELFPKGAMLIESPMTAMCAIDHNITTMKIGSTPICMKCLLDKANKGEIKLQVV